MYLASQRYSGTEIKRREATIEIVPSASQRRPSSAGKAFASASRWAQSWFSSGIDGKP
jgi:hypothetical protein